MAVKKDTQPMKTATKKKEKKEEKQAAVKRVRIKLVRSVIGRPRIQREVVKGLGLRRLNSEVVRNDSPEIWGMIKKIPHLVKVEEEKERK